MWARSDSSWRSLSCSSCARMSCCHIGAGAAIATEFSVGVKHWLAAGLHVHRRAIAAQPAIYEVTERFTCIESCPNKPPLLRFRFKVESVIPARRANSIGRVRTKRILGQQREFVVRTDFPKPIGGGFGVVAELRFALPQCLLGALELFNIQSSPRPTAVGFHRLPGAVRRD